MPVEGHLARGPAAIVGQLLLEQGVLPGPVGQQLQLLEVDRLLHVVERAQLDRLDRTLDGAIRGHDDDRNGGVELADPAEQVDAAHTGQAHVGEHHVRPEVCDQLHRRSAVAGHLGLVARFGEKGLDRPGQGALVVHDQHGSAAVHTAASLRATAGSRTRTVVPPGRLAISSRPPFCST